MNGIQTTIRVVVRWLMGNPDLKQPQPGEEWRVRGKELVCTRELPALLQHGTRLAVAMNPDLEQTPFGGPHPTDGLRRPEFLFLLVTDCVLPLVFEEDPSAQITCILQENDPLLNQATAAKARESLISAGFTEVPDDEMLVTRPSFEWKVPWTGQRRGPM